MNKNTLKTILFYVFLFTDRTPFGNRPVVGEPLLDVSTNVRTKINR